MDAKKKGNELEIYTISNHSPEKKIKPTKWWHIDKEMLRFKLHFFLFSGALGATIPYIPVFGRNRIGLSATSLAAILTTQQFMFIFTKPLMGYMADYFNKLKATIYILTVVQVIFFFLLLTIPSINNSHTVISPNFKKFVPPSDTRYVSYQYKNCQLHQESINTSVKNSLSLCKIVSNVYCFIESDKSPEVACKCIKITLNESNGSDVDIILPITDKKFIYEWNSSSSVPMNISNETSASMCELYCKTTNYCFILSCPDVVSISSETDHLINRSEFRTYQFWLFSLFSTISAVCLNALFTLSDTALCESVQKVGADFGRQRLYGAFGWGLMAPVGGLLNDYTEDYLTAWIVMGVMSIISLCNLYSMDLVKPHFSQNILKDVRSVFQSRGFITFELGVLMNGICIGIIWFYFVWFLTTIGGSRFLCGMALSVQCFVGAIPFMFVSGSVIKKLGHFNILTLSLMAYCIRFCWYSYLENPWLVLPMECVHGFTYGLFFPTVASYAKMSAKPGTEATTQAILFTTHEGLGAGLGCVLAGIGFDYVGSHKTFFFTSSFAGCGMVISIIFTLCNKRQMKSVAVTPSIHA